MDKITNWCIGVGFTMTAIWLFCSCKVQWLGPSSSTMKHNIRFCFWKVQWLGPTSSPIKHKCKNVEELLYRKTLCTHTTFTLLFINNVEMFYTKTHVCVPIFHIIVQKSTLCPNITQINRPCWSEFVGAAHRLCRLSAATPHPPPFTTYT
jgi:hypothetical protein